ncbi:hypothetical protein MKW92_006045 [Papaver armeniacum]|nr:hypothetical protein MKW92_006045 [Papaver armeniacum]
MDIANRLARNEQEISQVEEEKLQREQMLGLAMQWIRDRIRDLEDKKRALLQEKEALLVDLAFALESNRGGNGDNGGN